MDDNIPLTDSDISITDYDISQRDYGISQRDYDIPLTDYDIPLPDYGVSRADYGDLLIAWHTNAGTASNDPADGTAGLNDATAQRSLKRAITAGSSACSAA